MIFVKQYTLAVSNTAVENPKVFNSNKDLDFCLVTSMRRTPDLNSRFNRVPIIPLYLFVSKMVTLLSKDFFDFQLCAPQV